MIARRGRRRLTCARGQASVELVALVPLVVLVVAAVVQLLAAGAAREQAGAAAEAGAMALLQGADAEAAVRDALGGALDRADVAIQGHAVRVTVRPRAFAPPVAELLAATSTADAGPRADTVVPTEIVRGGDGDSSAPAAHATTDGELVSALAEPPAGATASGGRTHDSAGPAPGDRGRPEVGP